MADWMSGRRSGQLAMAKTWVTVIDGGGKRTAWGIPDPEIQKLVELTDEAETMLEQATAVDRNSVTTAWCGKAFGELTAHMRDMKNRRFFVPPLAEPDLISLGLNPHDNIKTTIADPAGQAAAEVTYPGPHLLLTSPLFLK